MHSFAADHNEIAWTLVVEGDVAGWPEYRRAFPVIVRPATRRTHPMSEEPTVVIRLDGDGRVHRPGETLSGEYWIESLERRTGQGDRGLRAVAHRGEGRRGHGRS